MDQTMNAMRQEALIAVALLAALKSDGSSSQQPRIEIEDVSRLLFKMKQAGVALGDLALRRVPEGYYSEDVEMMLGHYLAANLATRQSPISINETGMRTLQAIVEEEKKINPIRVKEAAAALEVNL
jgi:hypothetical protein